MVNQNPPLKTENRQLARLVPADRESGTKFERQPRDSGRTADATAAERQPVAEGTRVSGQWLLAIPEAVTIASGSFRTLTEQHMAAAGIGDIQQESWYARDELLAAFARLQETIGAQIVERVGRFLPAILDWPDGATTLRAALAAFGDWYATWHRGDTDAVAFSMVGTATGELTLATPYPDQFERGLVRGLIHEFGREGEYARLAGQETASDGAARYEITFFGSDPGTD